MKSLADWLDHLESLHPKGQSGIELGLERVSQVNAALRQSQHCPLIIVGGTNGKGSTCAYLEEIYSQAGCRVGCYTSPHLLAYNERVRVNGRPVADSALCEAFSRVEAARLAAGTVALTYFEFGTLAAWEVFAAERAEVIILEVGLGGRLDAVNIYEPDCAVVTGVAIDHTDWLGATREAIGYEKAGIYRAGKPAFCADPEPPQSLIDHAQAIGADLHLIGRDFSYSIGEGGWSYQSRIGKSHSRLPPPALRGECQLRNASLALAVIDKLGERLPVPDEAVRRGLAEVRVVGRFQTVQERPFVILDVAHNPQALAVFAENLESVPVSGRTLAVVGMLADKDIAGALAALAGQVDLWLLADLKGPRAAPASMLTGVASSLGGSVECFSSPAEAFERAVGLAGENDRILVFGSFHTVADVLHALQQHA